MSESERITQELDAIAVIVDASQGLVADGKVIDLAGLDERVDTLCADIAAQPVASSRGLKNRLILMIEGLDRLVASLNVQHKDLGAALKDVADRQRAVTAYGPGAAAPRERDPGK